MRNNIQKIYETFIQRVEDKFKNIRYNFQDLKVK